MVRNRQLKSAVAELEGWWPSLAADTRTFILSILAALPGSHRLEDAVEAGLVSPAPVGWLELDLLTALLSSLNDGSDVDYALSHLLKSGVDT